MNNNTLTLKTTLKINAFIKGLFEESPEGILIIPKEDPLNEQISELLFKSPSKSKFHDWPEVTIKVSFTVKENETLRDVSHKMINSELNHRFKNTLVGFIQEGMAKNIKQYDLINLFIQKYNLENITPSATLKRIYNSWVKANPR